MKQHKRGLAVCLAAAVLLLIAALLAGSPGPSESVQEAMRDAVLHGTGQVSLLGLMTVNPGMISALLVTAFLLLCAALVRIFAIPRFQYRPGRLQLLLEELVGLFDNMAKSNSPHRSRFLGAYLFAAGSYIFVGTLSELLGLQAVTVHGHPITLPAPLSDVNAAIAMGTLSYLVILSGGIASNGLGGVGKTPEGILPANIHELPPVRRAAQRPSGDGAGVLLRGAQLCAARGGGGAVHPAPRPHPDLCAHHAHRAVLRRGVRALPQKGEKEKAPGGKCLRSFANP